MVMNLDKVLSEDPRGLSRGVRGVQVPFDEYSLPSAQ